MSNTPAPLEIRADRATYNREHIVLAFLGSALMYGGLWYVGNPFPWTGIVGAFFGIFIRWIYVASEAMDVVWTLSPTHLSGPAERSIPLASITNTRSLFSAAQVATVSGDKYMLKYLANPQATADAILAARDRRMT